MQQRQMKQRHPQQLQQRQSRQRETRQLKTQLPNSGQAKGHKQHGPMRAAITSVVAIGLLLTSQGTAVWAADYSAPDSPEIDDTNVELPIDLPAAGMDLAVEAAETSDTAGADPIVQAIQGEKLKKGNPSDKDEDDEDDQDDTDNEDDADAIDADGVLAIDTDNTLAVGDNDAGDLPEGVIEGVVIEFIKEGARQQATPIGFGEVGLNPESQLPAPSEIETVIFTGDDFVEVSSDLVAEFETGDLVQAVVDDDDNVTEVIAIDELTESCQSAAAEGDIQAQASSQNAGAAASAAIASAAIPGQHTIDVVLMARPGVTITEQHKADARKVVTESNAFWNHQTRNTGSTGTLTFAPGSVITTNTLTSCSAQDPNATWLAALRAAGYSQYSNRDELQALPWEPNKHLLVITIGCESDVERGAVASVGGTGSASGPWGTGGGGLVLVSGYLNTELFLTATAHELGHNLGLYHASAVQCSSGHHDHSVTATITKAILNQRSVGLLTRDCVVHEYADFEDVMGYTTAAWKGPGELSAIGADSIGISVPTKQITASGTSTLASLSSIGTTPRALIITDPDTKEEYWIELRTPDAYNNGLDNYYVANYFGNSGLRVTKKITSPDSQLKGTVVIPDRVYTGLANPLEMPKLAFGIPNTALDTKDSFTSESGSFTVSTTGLTRGAKTAQVEVTFHKEAPATPIRTTKITGGTVKIAGTPIQIDTVLTATMSAPFAPADVQISYQWLRNGEPISGSAAKKENYTITSSDVGKNISVAVTASKSGYDSVTRTSAAKEVKYAKFTKGTHKITGKMEVGQTLTAELNNPNQAFVPAPTSIKYQWLRDGQLIGGAEAKKQTYKLVAADIGKSISVQVTAAKTGYETYTMTASARTVNKLAFTKGSAKITNVDPKNASKFEFGQTLIAGPTTASNDFTPAPDSKTYQWYRDGVAITGAKGKAQTYDITTADIGREISVQITGIKAGYESVTKTSAPVVVSSAKFTKGSAKVLGDIPHVGETFTAGPTNANQDFAPTPSNITYQWFRNGQPIKGATKQTYKLVAADADTMISVQITASKAGFTSLTKVSPERRVHPLGHQM